MARTYKTEFPDYDGQDDAESLLAMGWQDQSWHNDICPSFHKCGSAIFADYVNPELSEYGQGRADKRFTVIKLDSNGCYISDGDSWDFSTLLDAVACAIGHQFARLLQEALTQEQWQEVRLRNALPDYAGPVCASHNFCDANEYMAESFADIMGRDFLPNDSPPSDDDCTLWNRAWTIAKAQYLTA